jgi:hypothetical protein
MQSETDRPKVIIALAWTERVRLRRGQKDIVVFTYTTYVYNCIFIVIYTYITD